MPFPQQLQIVRQRNGEDVRADFDVRIQRLARVWVARAVGGEMIGKGFIDFVELPLK